MSNKSAFTSFAKHLQQPKNVETIMKHFSWCVVCAHLPKLALANATPANLGFGLFAWVAFLILMTLNMMFVLDRIVTPSVEATFRGWKVARIRRGFAHTKGALARAKLAFRTFSSKGGITFMVLAALYFYGTNAVVQKIIEMKY